MANAMVALANLTLGSAQATVTFGSIPATYRDLMLVTAARSDSVNAPFAQVRMQFNADTGSNYAFVEMTGDGSSPGGYAATQTEVNLGSSAPSSSGAGNFYMAITNIMDYSATDKHKTVLGRNGDASTNVRSQAARWASTSAITSIKIFPAPGYGNFATGSTFALYGIVS